GTPDPAKTESPAAMIASLVAVSPWLASNKGVASCSAGSSSGDSSAAKTPHGPGPSGASSPPPLSVEVLEDRTLLARSGGPLQIITQPITINATEGISTGPVKLASFVDPNVTTGSQASVKVDWGDGTTSTPTPVHGFSSSFDIIDSHTYADEAT